jgi:glycosyltransferase involved in cell wall biosynthesis
MPRLLYFVNIPRFFVSHRLPLALAARDAGYDVHVATAGDDAEHVTAIHQAGLPFHPIPLSQHGTRIGGEIDTLRAVCRLYRILQPDIVHHITVKPILYGGLSARILGIPAVHAVTGLGSIFVTPGLRWTAIRTATKTAYRAVLNHDRSQVIFQNPDDQVLFVRSGLVAEARTTVIKGSGVDMTNFQPLPEIEGKPVILFAGRLLWQKGVGEFVEAARECAKQGLKARFVIVGYGEPSSPTAVPLEKLREWQTSGVIEWWGKHDDMPQVFAQSHVVCLPSSYGEGVPKVLIEAAACGRAIVTTDIPGCREIVHNGENGLLIPPRDVEALCAAITQLVLDIDLRQRMGARGREIAEGEFSLEHVCAETLALYERLLSS